MDEEIKAEVQSWGDLFTAQFVTRIRTLRKDHPEWWTLTDFRYHLDIELRLRTLAWAATGDRSK